MISSSSSSSSSIYRSSFFSGYGLNKLTFLRHPGMWQRPQEARLEATSHEIDWPRMLSILAKMMRQALSESSRVTPNFFVNLSYDLSKSEPVFESLPKSFDNPSSPLLNTVSKRDGETYYNSMEKIRNRGCGAFFSEYYRNMLEYKTSVNLGQDPLASKTCLVGDNAQSPNQQLIANSIRSSNFFAQMSNCAFGNQGLKQPGPQYKLPNMLFRKLTII
jgi:hypothetical protein